MTSYTHNNPLFDFSPQNVIDFGIQSYQIASLDTPDLKIPENIYISTEPNPAKAARDMFWAMYKAPTNFASWHPPDSVFPKDLRERIAAKKSEDPTFFDFVNFKRSSVSERAYSSRRILSMRHEFAQSLKRTNLSGADKALAEEWMDTSLRVLREFSRGVQRSHLNASYGEIGNTKDPRSLGYNKLSMHIDAANLTRYRTFLDSPDMNPIIATRLRCLWSQNDMGVLCTDQNDIADETKIGHIAFKNPHPVLYAAAPWSITLVSANLWPHDPGVHCSPLKRADGTNLQRLLWDFSLASDGDFNSEDYKKWVTEHQGHMPLFDLG